MSAALAKDQYKVILSDVLAAVSRPARPLGSRTLPQPPPTPQVSAAPSSPHVFANPPPGSPLHDEPSSSPFEHLAASATYDEPSSSPPTHLSVSDMHVGTNPSPPEHRAEAPVRPHFPTPDRPASAFYPSVPFPVGSPLQSRFVQPGKA